MDWDLAKHLVETQIAYWWAVKPEWAEALEQCLAKAERLGQRLEQAENEWGAVWQRNTDLRLRLEQAERDRDELKWRRAYSRQLDDLAWNEPARLKSLLAWRTRLDGLWSSTSSG